MSEPVETKPQEQTAVDDVRRVREGIAKRHGGDLRAHMEETNRIFEELRERLNLRVVEPAKGGTKRVGG